MQQKTGLIKVIQILDLVEILKWDQVVKCQNHLNYLEKIQGKIVYKKVA